ncbi:hypothetical protein KKI23_00665, partial [Patescibacteria group bacterium]|nr:hypothetical protein [Patescibacteria group bacterium]
MYAEIIPQIRLPKSIGLFDYQIPDCLENDIKVGQLVSVPFRKRQIDGLVIKIKKSSLVAAKAQPIGKILNEKPLLTPTQMELITRLTDYYLVSPALLLKIIMPQVPKKKSTTSKSKMTPKKLPLKVATKRIAQLKKISRQITKSSNPSLIHHNSLAEIFYLYLILLKSYQPKNGQVLIIVPEVKDIFLLFPLISAKFSKVGYYHSQLSKTQQYELWQKVLNNEIKILIGTRPAVFFPFTNLKLLIIDQEESESHKQYDQNPRYDVRLVV